MEISTENSIFDKIKKNLYIPTYDRPQKITLVSHHTGRKISFTADYTFAAEHEFWDGMKMSYRPDEECNVDILYLCDKEYFDYIN